LNPFEGIFPRPLDKIPTFDGRRVLVDQVSHISSSILMQ
jgi:hypothetical protein